MTDKHKKKKRRAGGDRPAAVPARRDAAGRVHLALHRDPASGREQVSLKAAIFGEAWQNEVAGAAAATVRAMLGAAPTLDGVVALTRKVMSSTSQLAEGFLARAAAGAVACAAGCDHCCYQSVGVTPAEALTILQHLKQTRSPEELDRFAEHVAARYEATRALSSVERFSPEHPCVFLAAGRCSIYEARPLSCRGMNSLDAQECASRLREPAARAAFLASSAGSHAFLEPIRAFHALSAGLQLGLSELYGLDMHPLDLVAAMQLLLGGSEEAAERWLRGEAAFAAARGGDSSEDRSVRALSGVLRD